MRLIRLGFLLSAGLLAGLVEAREYRYSDAHLHLSLIHI